MFLHLLLDSKGPAPIVVLLVALRLITLFYPAVMLAVPFVPKQVGIALAWVSAIRVSTQTDACQ